MRVWNSRPNGPACAYTRVESLKIEERPPTATSARQPRTTSGCWRFVTTPSSLFRTVPNPNPTHPIGVVIVPGPGAMPGPVFFCFSRAAASQPQAGTAASLAPDAGPLARRSARAAGGPSGRRHARGRIHVQHSQRLASPHKQRHYDLGAGHGVASRTVARRPIPQDPTPGAPARDRRTAPGTGRGAGCRTAPPTPPTRVRQAPLEQGPHRGHDAFRIRAAAQQVGEVLQDAVKGVLWGPGHSRILLIRPRRSPSGLKPTTVSTTSPPLKNRSVGTARTE